jgi:hypothetical protein
LRGDLSGERFHPVRFIFEGTPVSRQQVGSI